MFRPGPSLCAGGSGLQPPRSTEGHDRQLGLANLVIQRPEPIAAGALPLPPPRRVARDDQRPPATHKRPSDPDAIGSVARSQATPELAGRKACAPCSPTCPTKPRRACCSDSPSIYQRSPTRDLRRARAVRPRERLTRRPGRALHRPGPAIVGATHPGREASRPRTPPTDSRFPAKPGIPADADETSAWDDPREHPARTCRQPRFPRAEAGVYARAAGARVGRPWRQPARHGARHVPAQVQR